MKYFLDNIDVMNCAKFAIHVSSTFCKNCQNNLTISHLFSFFAILTYQMTSKFKFDLIRPT